MSQVTNSGPLINMSIFIVFLLFNDCFDIGRPGFQYIAYPVEHFFRYPDNDLGRSHPFASIRAGSFLMAIHELSTIMLLSVLFCLLVIWPTESKSQMSWSLAPARYRSIGRPGSPTLRYPPVPSKLPSPLSTLCPGCPLAVPRLSYTFRSGTMLLYFSKFHIVRPL